MLDIAGWVIWSIFLVFVVFWTFGCRNQYVKHLPLSKPIPMTVGWWWIYAVLSFMGVFHPLHLIWLAPVTLFVSTFIVFSGLAPLAILLAIPGGLLMGLIELTIPDEDSVPREG